MKKLFLWQHSKLMSVAPVELIKDDIKMLLFILWAGYYIWKPVDLIFLSRLKQGEFFDREQK